MMVKASRRYKNPTGLGLGILALAAYLDNVRGPLLPHIADDLDFDYSGASQFLVVGYLAALVFTALLLPFLNRFSERNVTVAAILFSGFACFYSNFVVSLPTLLLLAVGIGVATALLGAMSNVLVISGSHKFFQDRNLCMLHAMYGIGSMSATLVTGQIFAGGLPWSWAFNILLLPLCLVAAACGRLAGNPQVTTVRHQPLRLGFGPWLMVALLGAYVAGEVLLSMWMTTYLVNTGDLTIAEAAWYPTAFFLVMATTRLLTAIMANFVSSRLMARLLAASLIAGCCCAIIGLSVSLLFLPLAGLLGPFFPLLIARASILFPEQNRTITLYMIITMQATLATLHFCTGWIAQNNSLALAYRTAPAALLVACGLLAWHFWYCRQANGSVQQGGRETSDETV